MQHTNPQQRKRGLLVLDQAYVKEVCHASDVRMDYAKLSPYLETIIPGLKIYEKWWITSVQNPSEAMKMPFYSWLLSGMGQTTISLFLFFLFSQRFYLSLISIFLKILFEVNKFNFFFSLIFSVAPPNGPQYRIDLRELKRKKFHCRNCGAQSEDFVQKGVDISIATLILKHCYQNLADAIILFAGDGDFKEMLRICRDELYREVYIIGRNDDSISKDLQSLGNVIWLEDIIPHVAFQPSSANCIICGSVFENFKPSE